MKIRLVPENQAVKGRVCVLCEHFRYEEGDPGYSEYTPGSNASMGCGKGYWYWRNYTAQDFRTKLLSAERCADFEPARIP